MEDLKKLAGFRKRSGPLVLVIMDGIGYGQFEEGDAVRSALTPQLDWLHANCPHTRLKAHGTAVGLPSDADMGNSEVGHNAIGAGRVFEQGAKLVNAAISSGKMFEPGSTWQELVQNCVANGTTLHFIGLFSDGNVHSHIDHLKAMLRQAQSDGVHGVRIHALLDGRDVGETSALEYIDPFEEFLAELNNAGDSDYRIASGGGRMFITMDRYQADWQMVRRGWETHVHGKGRQFKSAHAAVQTLRTETGAIDQDLPAFVVAEDGEPVGRIKDGDAVIFFNYRGDRSIEITAAFEEDSLAHFDRDPRPHVLYAGMMEYDGDLHVPKKFLVPPPAIDRTVGTFLCQAGIRSMAISEVQKYGHVTYFFNGNRSGLIDADLEQYVEIPSDSVPFEQRPWMKAAEITDHVTAAVATQQFDFIRLNLANGDMVGHTGVYQAAQIAVETVDLCLGRLLKAVAQAGGVMIISADHGNADDMYEHDKSGAVKIENGKRKVKTAHSLNPVPCIIYDPTYQQDYAPTLREGLGISSLAATCMNLLGFEAPEGYDPSIIDTAVS